MQPICDFPEEEFFEEIDIHTLDHLSGDNRIRSKEFHVFGHVKEFRGMKSTFYKGLPFYLLHEEAYRMTLKIFKDLFRVEPDLITYLNDDEKRWNAFILGRSKMMDDRFVKNLGFNYYPLIGCINSYELDRNPAFFYLIGTQSSKGQSVLTLDNFRFKKDEDKKSLITLDTWQRRLAQDEICYQIAQKFAKAQEDFNELMTQMSSRSIEREYFAPVVLDIYDRNRNPESIRNDNELRNRVKYLFRDANDFVETNTSDFYREITPLKWTEFIFFILRYNYFNFEQEPRLEKVEELFSKKDAYRKFVKLFRNFLKNEKAYHRYVANQVDDWERIKADLL